jgi:hypothetical protein
MVKLIFISGVILLSCGSVKKNQSAAKKDSANVPVERVVKDSSITPAANTQLNNGITIPKCIKNKIDSFKLMQKYEQPQRITEYDYKGKKVYYIVMPCCDFFNEVYDDHCKFLGSPNGGITGKGDGKLPDFFNEVTREKLIWQAAK